MGCNVCNNKNDLNVEQLNENKYNNNEDYNNSFLSIINPNNNKENNNENQIIKIPSNINKKDKENIIEKTNSFNSTNHTFNQKISLDNLRMLMLNEINLSREFPKKIPEKIEKYENNIGKNTKNEYYIKVDNYNKIKLFKGIEIINNCKIFLNNLEELFPYILKNELTFPFNNNNNLNLEETISEFNLTKTLTQLSKELKLKKIEIINFHYDIMNSNIELSVLLQIIDDTNSQFQRRKNIFLKDAKYIGINVGRINESLFCYFLIFAKDL